LIVLYQPPDQGWGCKYAARSAKWGHRMSFLEKLPTKWQSQ